MSQEKQKHLVPFVQPAFSGNKFIPIQRLIFRIPSIFIKQYLFVFFCPHFRYYFLVHNIYVSIYVSIYLCRYRAIVKPLDSKHSGTTTSIVLRAALIWVFSLVLAIPEAVFSDLHTFNVTSTNESFVTCAPYPHAGELHPKIHSMASFLIFYIIPLLVISVYYVFIAKNLMRSALNLPVEDNVYARQQAS